MPPLEKVVAELAPRKSTLGKLDASLLESLKAVEAKLHAHIPTRVSVVTESSQEGLTEWVEMLTYGKWDGKWQLLLESGANSDPETWKTQPLVTASREKRVAVFTGGHIENLVRLAAAQLDEQIAERQKALAIAGTLIGALEADDDDIPF